MTVRGITHNLNLQIRSVFEAIKYKYSPELVPKTFKAKHTDFLFRCSYWPEATTNIQLIRKVNKFSEGLKWNYDENTIGSRWLDVQGEDE